MKRLAAALEHKVPPPLIGALCASLMWLICGMPPLTGRPPLLLVPALALVVLGLTVDAAGVLSFRRARTTVNPFAPERTVNIVSSGIYRLSRNPHVLGHGLHTYRVGGVAVAGAGCAWGGAFRCLDNAFSDYSRRAGSHPEVRYRIPAVPPAGTALGISPSPAKTVYGWPCGHTSCQPRRGQLRDGKLIDGGLIMQ